MITVTPIQEKALQAEFCALCGIPYQVELLAYAAYNDKEEFVGICQFGLDPAGGHVYHLECPTAVDADDALFVIGRATLNFIDLCGGKTAFFDGEVKGRDALLRRIGLVCGEDGRYTVSLDGFFDHPCQHHDC